MSQDANGNIQDAGTTVAAILALSTLKGRTISVEKGGNDSNEGTPDNPLLTIAAAITKAKGLTTVPSYTDPVVILLGPGEWDEAVTLDYHGIHIMGHGQYVTRLKRAGTCLTIQDNGTDPEPWDCKIVGMSIESTDANYSVVVAGIASTSLAGNELSVKQ